MKRVSLSFDDGLLDQFKWARGLYRYGIRATFYVNPFTIGFTNYLKTWQLHKMQNEWHHTIANHFWIHEAPAEGGTIEELLVNLVYASKWLEENGFAEGSKLVALPYGSVGGKWTDEHIKMLTKNDYQVRDVGNGTNGLEPSMLLNACESTYWPLQDDSLNLRYFHWNSNTSDLDLMTFVSRITDSDAEIVTMRELYEECMCCKTSY